MKGCIAFCAISAFTLLFALKQSYSTPLSTEK